MKLLVKSRYEEIDPERSLSLDLFDFFCSMLMREHIEAPRGADRSRDVKAEGKPRRNEEYAMQRQKA